MTIQAQILELMKNLTREFGVALIVSTHNLGVVARYADRVNVMYAGKIVERGSAREIYANPSHLYTVGLLHSVPRLDLPRLEKLDPIEGQPPDQPEQADNAWQNPGRQREQQKLSQSIPHDSPSDL